jgi:hypothetical protein
MFSGFSSPCPQFLILTGGLSPTLALFAVNGSLPFADMFSGFSSPCPQFLILTGGLSPTLALFAVNGSLPFADMFSGFSSPCPQFLILTGGLLVLCNAGGRTFLFLDVGCFLLYPKLEHLSLSDDMVSGKMVAEKKKCGRLKVAPGKGQGNR